MRRSQQVPTSLRRMASLTVVATAIIALANLPADNLPIPWLLAFTIPGAILGFWSRVTKRPWQRALAAVVLQATACYLALDSVGPMTRPAALACTILPPLAFATTRNHDGDPSLALFLSFCVLLVGIILDGVDVRLLLAYGTAAFLTLHLATLAHAYRSSNPTSPKRRLQAADLMATSMMMLSCIVAVFAIERTLRCLPSPSSNSEQADEKRSDTSGGRAAGLDDSFVLDGGNGLLSELNGEQLVRAIAPRSQPIPAGMYLRCGFFSVAGMDQWSIGELRLRSQSGADDHVIKPASQSAPIRRLTIQRFAGAAKFVFLPPNSLRLRGISDLEVDPLRGWIRPRQPNDDVYVVTYQDLPAPGRSAPIERDSSRRMLTQVPADLDLGLFDQLLMEWQVSDSPLQAMRAIASGLAKHCRYSRSEPIGEYRHKIENFLFADGDRRGYCMHFASAAALMLRLKGIPCRIAVGLYGGDEGKGSANERIYGSQHAHAWIEVPFEGRGFVIYDPTPPDSRGVAVSPSTPSTQPIDPEADLGESALQATVRLINQAVSTSWLWAALVGAIVVLTLMPRRAPSRRSSKPTIVAPEARRALHKILRALADAGHRRSAGQTLELFQNDLAARDRLEPEVNDALLAYQEVRFGGRDFDHEREQKMQRGLRAARAMQGSGEGS